MKKIIGIFIVVLLIATMILPASGKITISSTVNRQSNSINHSDFINSDGSKLEFMIAGSGLRCLRAYRIYIPPSYDGSEPVPLVLAFHGATSMGSNFKPSTILWFYQSTFFEDYTDFNEKADEEEFIVVYPKGLVFYLIPFNTYMFGFDNSIYPDSWYRWRNLVDDVGFIEDLIDKMHQDYNIDSDRIYLTGFSNGAAMAHSLGCVLSDKVAAISPVAGAVACKDADDEEYMYPPNPENPVSVVIFHGTNDSSCPWEGSQYVCAVNDSVQFWVEHNGCDPDPQINISDSGRIITTIYSNGSQGSEVVLYTVVNGKHSWYGFCSDLIWEFFEVHPKQ